MSKTEQMKALYEIVSKDLDLQKNFLEIMQDAEAAGEEATKERLTAFAKKAGYDVTVEEMQAFFKALTKSNEGELSDVELDQVAGGKGTEGFQLSVITIGLGCAFASIVAEIGYGGGGCADVFAGRR